MTCHLLRRSICRTLLSISAIALLVLYASPTVAEEKATDDGVPDLSGLSLDAAVPSDPAVVIGTSRSGVSYYLRTNSEPENRAELRLVVGVGSLQEDEKQLGLAHFLEHMAFNGTENFAKHEAVEYLRSIGMRFGAGVNASTSFDRTIYQLQVPTDDEEVLDKALQILEDWAAGISFEPEEIDRERGVVLEEWRGSRGVGSRVREKHMPLIYSGSRRAERIPIGDPDLIQNFPHEDLIRFYRDWYQPEFMALVAVGDFDLQTMQERIERAFRKLGSKRSRKLRSPQAPPPVVDRIELAEGLRFSKVLDPEIPRPRAELLLRHAHEPAETVGGYRDGLADALFLQMFNARLGERVQEADPPFLGGGASLSQVDDTTRFFSLSASADRGKLLRALEQVALEAERVRRHGFLTSELERQRTLFLRAYERTYEEREKTSSRAYVGGMIGHFLEGNSYPDAGQRLALVRRFLPEITVEQVNQRARRWASSNDRILLLNGPEEQAEELPVEKELLAAWTAAADAAVEPWVDQTSDAPLLTRVPEAGKITERATLEDPGFQRMVLDNGIQVFFKATDFKNDEVIFSAWSPGGTSLVEDDVYPSSELATTILSLSGLGEHSLIELGKLLTGKIASATPSIDEYTEGLRGGGSPDDLETLFQLIHLQATAQRFDAEAYASFESRIQGLIRNRNARPAVVFGDTINEAMTGGHPRRSPLDADFVAKVDHQKAFDVFQQRFADFSDWTFVFVGALDLERFESLVERYIASLPTLDPSDRDPEPVDRGIRATRGKVEREVFMGLEDKAQVQLLITQDFEQSVENRLALQAMIEVLRNRLRDRVREELGGTYGVSVSGSTTHRPIEEVGVSISFGTDPDRVTELEEVVMQELAKLRAGGVTEEEFDKVRQEQARSRETALRQNGFWLGSMSYHLQHGEDPAQITSFPKRLESLTIADVEAAAAAYLKVDNLGRFILWPAALAEEAESTSVEGAE